MSVATLPSPAPPPFPVHRFTVEEYHRLIDAGILTEDDRVELLEGWIVPKMTHRPRHDATIQIVRRRLSRVFVEGWDIRVQSAVTTDDSEPEPDVAAVRGDERTYLTGHPGPQDIGLLVEIAESSLQQDRVEKGRVHARARVGVYWIINLIDRQIEVYSDPTGPDPAPRYRRGQVYTGDQLVPVMVDGREITRIPAAELLP